MIRRPHRSPAMAFARTVVPTLFVAVALVGVAVAPVSAQGPGSPPGDANPPPNVIAALDPNGPRVAVIAYCADTVGSLGAANLQAALVAADRFSVVDVIDGDATTPSAAFLLANYDGVITATDNRCGINPPVLASAGQVLADYVAGGGGLVLLTFGFSGPAGIGFGPPIFQPGLSPLVPQSISNSPAGLVNILGASTTPPCDTLLDGVVANFNSTFANDVGLAGGATLCVSYTNGQEFLAVNADQTIVAINGFAFTANNIGNPNFARLVANALFLVSMDDVVGGFEMGSVELGEAAERGNAAHGRATSATLVAWAALVVASLVAFGGAFVLGRRRAEARLRARAGR